MSATIVDDAEVEDDPSGEKLPEDESGEPEEVWRSASNDPSPSHKHCVIHIDIDCFYAQVEMLERPELRDKPLGIQQKNIVVTSNYAARARGVGKCCLVSEALQACPELVLVNGSDLTRYRRVSARIHRLLTRFSRRVERLGFDENFLDVTEAATNSSGTASGEPLPGHALGDAASCSCGCSARLTAAARLASDVRRALKDALGITSCAGIGFNKLLAKLAGATHKPDQQTVVFAGGVDALLLSAGAARALPGVGSRTAAQLAELGVGTITDLRRASPTLLKPLGTSAAALRALAFGVDPSEVKPSSAALSIGVEDGFRRVDSVEECEVKLRELTRRVLVLLAEDGRVPTVLKVSIRRYNREDYGRFRESRQAKVPPSLFSRCREREVETADRLVAEAMVLLKKMLKDEPFHLTLLGLAVTGFSEQKESGKAVMAKFVQKATSSAAKRKSPSDAACEDAPPGGVDPGVWSSLPPDIKSELLRDQELGPNEPKKRRQRSIASFFGGAGSSSKSDAELVTLDDDDHVGCAAEPAGDSETTDAAADGDDGGDGKVTRSVSNSPVSVQDVDSEEEPGTDSDADDPGSPVISRSAPNRREAEMKEATRTAEVSGVTAERDMAGAGRASMDSRAKGGRSGNAVSPQAQSQPVSVKTAKSKSPPLAAVATRKSTQALSRCEVTGSNHDSHPAVAEVTQLGQTTSSTDSRLAPTHSSPSNIIETEMGAIGTDGGTLAGAEDWDPDVFSQLPPDIQFELKMARRSGQRGTNSGGTVSPRGLAAAAGAGAAKSGTILKFFKR